MAAAGKALDRAGIAIITSGHKRCLLESDGVDSLDSVEMEKLFPSLA